MFVQNVNPLLESGSTNVITVLLVFRWLAGTALLVISVVITLYIKNFHRYLVDEDELFYVKLGSLQVNVT